METMHFDCKSYVVKIVALSFILVQSISFAQGPANRPRPPQDQAPVPNRTPAPDRAPNQDPAQAPIPGVEEQDLALVALGEALFFDDNLSVPAGQSCASCHEPGAGFAEPDVDIPTSEGAVLGRFGNRNAPSARYAAFIPPFQADRRNRRMRGGLFLDGRADTLEEQAQAPFLNILEMNNPDKETVIDAVQAASYAQDFTAVFGDDAFDNIDDAYIKISQAIAAFERSAEFSPFSSKFDEVQRGQSTFTPIEQQGFNLFNGRARCVTCHSSQGNTAQVFSDFSYENIGVPANPDNPFYSLDPALNPVGDSFVDLGLGNVLQQPRNAGKFRVPTLRNVAATSPYMHNGVFSTLEEVVQFYNQRNRFTPEVAANVTNRGGINNLRLSAADVQALVAFLRTLSDADQQ